MPTKSQVLSVPYIYSVMDGCQAARLVTMSRANITQLVSTVNEKEL